MMPTSPSITASGLSLTWAGVIRRAETPSLDVSAPGPPRKVPGRSQPRSCQISWRSARRPRNAVTAGRMQFCRPIRARSTGGTEHRLADRPDPAPRAFPVRLKERVLGTRLHQPCPVKLRKVDDRVFVELPASVDSASPRGPATRLSGHPVGRPASAVSRGPRATVWAGTGRMRVRDSCPAETLTDTCDGGRPKRESPT